MIAERLAAGFEKPFFRRGVMSVPALSIAHFRSQMEQTVGPFQKLLESVSHDAPRLTALRGELEAEAAKYFEDNLVRQEFLLTRARKRG